jgi:hypothetical protein
MAPRFRLSTPAPVTVVALVVLFAAWGPTAYAAQRLARATGDPLIVGVANSATTATNLSSTVTTGPTITFLNTGGQSAARFVTAAAVQPFVVYSQTKVANLNADKLDGIDSTGLLRKSVAETAPGGTANGVVDVTNSGSGNGVQGKTGDSVASGVYGENTSPYGYGIAGRAGSGGSAVYGDNVGSGYAGYFEDKVHVNGPLEVTGNLVCTGCVGTSDISGKVDDADKLDGIDSTGFARGKTSAQAIAVTPGTNLFLGAPMAGFLRLSYFCPSPTTSNGFLYIYNDSGSLANVFHESGAANPTYVQMAAGDYFFVGAAAAGDSFHIQAQGALGVITIEVATVNRASDCHAQAQALLAP